MVIYAVARCKITHLVQGVLLVNYSMTGEVDVEFIAVVEDDCGFLPFP